MATDAISRSRVLDALETEKRRLMEQNEGSWPFTRQILIRAVDTVYEFVKALPALDVAPVVHEQWIEACRGKVCICSRCGQGFDYTCNEIKDEWLFCPKCGAKMDAEEDPPMSVEHFVLKDYPYEERRMDFFKQKRLEAERRVNHWAKRAVNSRYNSIQHEKACDAADEWNFYNDVIVMLGGEDGEPDGEKEL